jgi:hypothetical protein
MNIIHVAVRILCVDGVRTPFICLVTMISVRFAILTKLAKQMKRLIKRLGSGWRQKTLVRCRVQAGC